MTDKRKPDRRDSQSHRATQTEVQAGVETDRPHRQAVGQEGTEKCSVGGREAERLERLLRERELRKREGDGLITL